MINIPTEFDCSTRDIFFLIDCANTTRFIKKVCHPSLFGTHIDMYSILERDRAIFNQQWFAKYGVAMPATVEPHHATTMKACFADYDGTVQFNPHQLEHIRGVAERGLTYDLLWVLVEGFHLMPVQIVDGQHPIWAYIREHYKDDDVEGTFRIVGDYLQVGTEYDIQQDQWIIVVGTPAGYSVVEVLDYEPTRDDLRSTGKRLELQKYHGASDLLLAYRHDTFALSYSYVGDELVPGTRLTPLITDVDAELAWWPT